MKVAVLNGHGVGDGLLAFQCAHYVANQIGKNNVDIISCQRDEVYFPTWHLMGNLFNIKQHANKEKWAENNWILSNTSELEAYKQSNGYDEAYYVIPDLLYRNPYAFDWKRWRIHPNTIKSTRLLTHEWKPLKRIFINCVTTTQNYNYPQIDDFLRGLSKALPDHEIIVPTLDKWAGKPVYGNPSDLELGNVKVMKNIDLIGAIELLKNSLASICLDSGLYHISNQIGAPTILLDPWMDETFVIHPAFEARWRFRGDSLPLFITATKLVKFIVNLIQFPQLTLTGKRAQYHTNDLDYIKLLLFKY